MRCGLSLITCHLLLYASFKNPLPLHVCVFLQPHKGSQKKAKIPRAAGKMPVTTNDNKHFVKIRHNDPVSN